MNFSPGIRVLRYPLLLALVVAGFYWKLWLTDRYTWLQAPDFANQLMPWYQFQASEWHAGRIPLWNPYEWAGQSLIGQAQPGVVDPFNLILYAAPLTGNGWLRQDALHWFYISGYIAAAIAFWAFCRRALRISDGASAVAGLAYALSGIASSTNWPQMMHATIWGPLGLLYQFRAVEEDRPLRHGALSGMFLGLMWLSGHHQIPLYFTLASAALWLYFLATRFATKQGLLRAAVLSGLFLFLFGALQILPMAEYGRNARRWVGLDDPVGWKDAVPYKIHEGFSMRPLGLINLALKTSEPYEPFMGAAVLIFAAIGLRDAWRRRESVRWLVYLGLGGIVFALGAHSAVHGVLYALLPAIEKARVPAVAMVLANAAIAALAGFGIDALVRTKDPQKRLALWLVAGAAAAMIFVFGFHARYDYWPYEWIYLAISLAGVASLLMRPGARWLPAAAAALILVELSSFTGAAWEDQRAAKREKFADRLSGDADVAQFLQRAGGAFRINHSTSDIPFSYGDYWGFETVESFTASVPAAIWDIDVFDPALRDFASVRYDVGRKSARPDQVARFTSTASGMKVFENPGAFPRAWMVSCVTAVKEQKAAKGWMKTRGEARLREAIVYGDAPPAGLSCDAPAPTGEIEFVKRLPNELVLKVKTDRRAMLIVNDGWDPGWKASIDGRSTKIWQADGFVRGIVVGAGEHEICMVYRPDTVLAGLACLALGVIGIVGICRK